MTRVLMFLLLAVIAGCTRINSPERVVTDADLLRLDQSIVAGSAFVLDVSKHRLTLFSDGPLAYPTFVGRAGMAYSRSSSGVEEVVITEGNSQAIVPMASHPRASMDGVTYVRSKSGSWSVVEVTLHQGKVGSEIPRFVITGECQLSDPPTMSPSGRYLAVSRECQRTADPPEPQILVVDLQAGGSATIENASHGAWSNAGHVGFVRNGILWTFDAETHRQQMIEEASMHFYRAITTDGSGRIYAVVATPRGDTEVWRLQDGEHVALVSLRDFGIREIGVSANGSQLVFTVIPQK